MLINYGVESRSKEVSDIIAHDYKEWAYTPWRRIDWTVEHYNRKMSCINVVFILIIVILGFCKNSGALYEIKVLKSKSVCLLSLSGLN